jgi:HK97 family phage major capsid protein
MNIDEKAKEFADSVKASLNLDELLGDLRSEVKGLKDQLAEKASDAVLKVFVAEDTKKAINELTAEEKTKAFAHALFHRDHAVLKALSEGTPADGGYTVPQDFYRTLLEEMMEQNVMRPLITVVPMKTNVLTLTMIDHGPEVYWTSEGATKTTTTADFSQPTITAYKMAAIIYLTDELIDDSAFDLTQVLVKRFALKLAEAEERAVIAGTGTGQPTGIFVAGTVATRACAGNLSFTNIINLIYDLPVKFRRNARFLVHPNNVRELRLITDTTGRYMWQEPVSAGQPATIHGYPVVETYWAPESQIAFGDYREAYWLGDRQNVTVKITNDTETTFTQDKTGIRVVQRIGGTVVFPNAVRKLITIP